MGHEQNSAKTFDSYLGWYASSAFTVKGPMQPAYLERVNSSLLAIFVDYENGDNKETNKRCINKACRRKGPFQRASFKTMFPEVLFHTVRDPC